MDPLRVAASITALIELSSYTVMCLNDMKDGYNNCGLCAMEVSKVSAVLQRVLYHLNVMSNLHITVNGESLNDGLIMRVHALTVVGEPIYQYRSALQQLRSKFTSPSFSALRTIGSSHAWSFIEGDVSLILSKIEIVQSAIKNLLEMGNV